MNNDLIWAIEPNAAKLLNNLNVKSNIQLQPEKLNTDQDGIAMINVNGPLNSWFGTSTHFLQQQIQIALDTPSISTIILNIDSPGSSAIGMTEWSDWVYQASQIKPIIAYCTQACSGALLLAAATTKIVASESSILGSVGVIHYEYRDDELIILTSDNAPLKNRTVADDEGKQAILSLLNELEGIFIERLATYRSTSAKNIINKWGKGAVLTGSQAVKVGMVDELLDLSQLIEQLTMTQNTQDVGAVVQQALDEQAKSTNNALEAMTSKLLEKITAQDEKIAQLDAKHQTELQALQAEQQAKLDAETGRKKDIENLFAIVANETQYAAHYQTLKAECLAATAIDVETARLKILALQATFNHDNPTSFGVHNNNAPDDFMVVARQEAQKQNIPFGQAVALIARTQPQLHQQYLQTVNAGIPIEWRDN